MNKLNIHGNIFGTSGYSSHTYQLAKALDKHFDIALDTQLPANWPTLVDDQTNKWLNVQYPREVTLSISQPWAWPQKLADKPKKFIGFAVWEGDKVPKSWLNNLSDKRVNQIWVASNHTKQSILNTCKSVENSEIWPERWYDFLIKDKIKLIPHGVDTDIFKPLNLERDDKFTFIANKGWTGGMNDRGGMQYFLKAFKDEFTKKDKVKAIAKINSAYNPPNWNYLQAIKDIGIERTEDGAESYITNDSLHFSKLAEIYNSGDVFVCPTRAESFGLTMLEAMACKLPVITTNFGGQTDFINENNGWLIGGEFEEQRDIQYEGIKWLTPNMKQLRDQLRYCYDNQNEVKQKGEKALQKAQEFTWKNSAQKALEALNELI